jgi:uncharacterized protein (TIGR03437 family)
MSAPEIATTAAGTAVAHSKDSTLVTSSKPAAAGEALSIFATGLGPTIPPFPSNPTATVNFTGHRDSEWETLRCGAAVGYPGAADGYENQLSDSSVCRKGLGHGTDERRLNPSVAVSIAVH